MINTLVKEWRIAQPYIKSKKIKNCSIIFAEIHRHLYLSHNITLNEVW